MSRKKTIKVPDAELYLLIKSQDKNAFCQLYKNYSPLLYGLAIRSLRSQTYAEEVVELTFLKICNNVSHFKDQKVSFKIWIIQNLILATQEYLTSKKIRYDFRMTHFPNFSFDLVEENSEIFTLSEFPTLLTVQTV